MMSHRLYRVRRQRRVLEFRQRETGLLIGRVLFDPEGYSHRWEARQYAHKNSGMSCHQNAVYISARQAIRAAQYWVEGGYEIDGRLYDGNGLQVPYPQYRWIYSETGKFWLLMDSMSDSHANVRDKDGYHSTVENPHTNEVVESSDGWESGSEAMEWVTKTIRRIDKVEGLHDSFMRQGEEDR